MGDGVLLLDRTNKVFQNAGAIWSGWLFCDASQTDRVDVLDWKAVIEGCVFIYLHSGEVICDAVLDALFVLDF